MTPVLNK
jgi:hypothetical protein